MSSLNDNQKKSLCSTIRTSRYSRKVVTLLRDMSDNLYKTDSEGIMVNMEHSVDDDLLGVFNDVLSDIDSTKPMDAEEKLRLVIDYIKNVEEISFVVPIHPNREFVIRLHDWCTENIRDDILIDFSINRLMESGVLMVYKGKYFEYSLENLLDEYFSKHDMDQFVVGGLSQADEVDEAGNQTQVVSQQGVQDVQEAQE